MTATVTTQQQNTTSSSKKKLEGVVATEPLLAVYQDCLAICKKSQEPLLATVSTDSSEAPSPTSSSSTTNNATVTATPLLSVLSLEKAQAMLLEFEQQHINKKGKKKAIKVVPLPMIRAMKVVLQSNNNATEITTTVKELEEALQQTQLAFAVPESSNNNDKKRTDLDQEKFRKRMNRLRLQNEESKYCRLTANIGNNSRVQDDDITTKSMTYAASVGLNMIVAPISFGVFMFFFSGPVLRFLWSSYQGPTHPGAVDVRKVIIGVISGVLMLFIEMLLFVIRTHEFERGLAKKQRKKGGAIAAAVQPFGVYSSATEKTYTSSSAASSELANPSSKTTTSAVKADKKTD